MDKYYFTQDVYDLVEPQNIKYIGQKKVIKYKCLICGHTIDYNETWTDEKKAEVQAEADKHHAEHIIP